MKKLLLLVMFAFTFSVSNGQVRTLFELFAMFDQSLFSVNMSEYSITSFYDNPNTPIVRDSSTETNKIYRNANGKIDSIISGFRIKFSNDTFSIDTTIVMNKSIGQHFGDSSVYIDYNRNGSVWEPKYRLTITTNSNNKIKNYYSEYYQMGMGWDGQKNLYVFNSGNGKDFYSVKTFYISVNNTVTWKDSIVRYFNGNGKLVVDSNYNNNLPLPNYALYSYPNAQTMLATYYSNNAATGLVRRISFDSAGHISQMTQIERDTAVYIVNFKNDPDVNTGINELAKVENLHIYPNPVSAVLNIGINAKQIAILDITGKTVLTISDLTNGQINVGDLKPGLYFLNATDLNGSVYKSKFVKE